VERIRETRTEEEIVDALADTVEAISEYRERFDAASPEEVSLIDPDGEASVEELWEALSEWRTLERRADLLDAARRGEPAAARDPDSVDA
jgi:hypothetical protein